MRIRCTMGPAAGDEFEVTIEPRGALVIDGEPFSPTDARLNGFEVVAASGQEFLALRAAGFDLPFRGP